MILLDTHIWVWWVDDNQRLTQKHRERLVDALRETLRTLGLTQVPLFKGDLGGSSSAEIPGFPLVVRKS